MFWNKWYIVTEIYRSRPTITNKMMANTFRITNIFSIRAASFIPRDNSNAVKIITTAAMISMTPPLLPNGLDNDLGKDT